MGGGTRTSTMTPCQKPAPPSVMEHHADTGRDFHRMTGPGKPPGMRVDSEYRDERCILMSAYEPLTVGRKREIARRASAGFYDLHRGEFTGVRSNREHRNAVVAPIGAVDELSI